MSTWPTKIKSLTVFRKEYTISFFIVREYVLKYEQQPHCLPKDGYFLSTYRLHREDECKAFFEKINSPSYRELIKTEPIQYIIKVGHGAHRSQGVFLLDAHEEEKLKGEYGMNGENCGKINQSLLAQTYLGNPLLVDGDRKLDFRVYFLVSSVNPLIAFYHEGVIRVSLYKFNKTSTDVRIETWANYCREAYISLIHICQTKK